MTAGPVSDKCFHTIPNNHARSLEKPALTSRQGELDCNLHLLQRQIPLLRPQVPRLFEHPCPKATDTATGQRNEL
jgi:hypothetical protein